MRNIIQIAGVQDMEEARMLANSGVDWLGFPFGLPVHSEDLLQSEAAQIIRTIHAENTNISFVLITYLSIAFEIASLAGALGVNRIQLHGAIGISEVQTLRNLCPQLYLIKSLVVRENNIAELQEIIRNHSPVVDAFITDTHDPQTGADGATGKIHDWSISAQLAASSSKPVILAGGLNAENVQSAILQVRPFGIDVHTGVEDSRGRKDAEKVKAFVSAARRAFISIQGT